MSKPILCLDFDGVIHSYTSGWKGADVIPDPPVEGAAAFIFEATRSFRVAVYSSRSGQPGGLDAMQNYVLDCLQAWDSSLQSEDTFSQIEWPTEKPPALVTIDDRAITFTGEWPSMDTIKNFKPWNKK